MKRTAATPKTTSPTALQGDGATVVVVDTAGEAALFFALTSAAFVGGVACEFAKGATAESGGEVGLPEPSAVVEGADEVEAGGFSTCAHIGCARNAVKNSKKQSVVRIASMRREFEMMGRLVCGELDLLISVLV